MDKADYIEILIKNITCICREKNITPHMLGKESGVGKDIITNMNKGSLPSCDKLAKIADYCNISVDYLLGRTDNPHTISEHSIKTGSVGDNSSNNDTSVKISDSMQGKLDEMSAELLKKFSELSFDEKIDVFNYIKNKKEL